MRLVHSLMLAALLTGAAHGQLPTSGKPVPVLESFDALMQNFMADRGIAGGVLGVSKDGVIIYQRGFGSGIPENTPMRIASVEKPIVAAATVKLMGQGVLDMNDTVFNVMGSGGILPHQPFNGSWSSTPAWLASITVGDLLSHQSGWDRCASGDPQFQTLGFANAMGIPPSQIDRDDIISYMLTQPVDFQPGTSNCSTHPDMNCCYSNFGYMVLGRVIEEVTGMGLMDYIRTEVLTPAMWVPNQEVIFGRTFAANQNPREPYYQCAGSCECTNVFNPGGSTVPCPYGNWHHEAFLGHGNLVVSAAPLLTYMNSYQIGVGAGAGALLQPGSFGVAGNHAGRLVGTSTIAWQRGDGINCVVLFTRGGGSHAEDFSVLLDGLIDWLVADPQYPWPTTSVDGFWVDFNYSSGSGVGGYNVPFNSMPQALGVGAGAKLRLKPGSTSWTGIISSRTLIDAPLGTAVIGQQ